MKSNKVSQDKRLSFKARGLFDYMWSMPDNWQFTNESLAKDSDKDGRDAVRSGLKELEKFGYLSRRQIRLGNTGVFSSDTEYNLYDDPDNNLEYRTDDGKSNFGTDDGLSDVGKPVININKHTSKENKRDILIINRQQEVEKIFSEYLSLLPAHQQQVLKKEQSSIISRIVYNLDASVKNIKRYVTTTMANELRVLCAVDELGHYSKGNYELVRDKEFSAEEKQLAQFDWGQALNEESEEIKC
jgi:hypothetical protein